MAFIFQDLFNLFWSTIPDDKKQECKTPLKLARKIFPDALFIAATEGRAEDYEHTPLQTGRSSTFYRLSKGIGPKTSQKIAALLAGGIDKCSGEPWTYENCRCRLAVEEKWRSLLQELSDKEQRELLKATAKKIRYLSKSSSHIGERKDALLQTSLEERFTFFTLLAVTYYYWDNEQSSEAAGNLRALLLPPAPESPGPDPERARKEAAKMAEKRLITIQDKIDRISEDAGARENCANTCRRILEMKDLKDSAIKGRACYILYLCCLPADQKTAYDYLAKSVQFGYEEAIVLRNSIASAGLLYPVEKSRSACSGYCIYNADNSCFRLYRKSVPDDWESVAFDCYLMFSADVRGREEAPLYGAGRADGGSRPDGADRTETTYSGKKLILSGAKHRFLLFDEDMRKNFVDLLSILEFVRENSLYDFTDNIDIYIRCREEVYGALIDTAQKNLEGNILRIHILDDDKTGAQYLLSRHPLFYPVREVGTGSPTLHFVIVGSDACAEWLVRESFWMLTFLPGEIKAKIIILAPDAGQFYNRLVTKLPGFRKDREFSHSVSNKLRTPIEYKNTELDNYNLNLELEKLLKSKEYLYFAISTGDDEKNLSLGITLREYMIRNVVYTVQESSGKEGSVLDKLRDLPPIAFRCRDENIAFLSRHLVVNNLDSGDSWYNNYALIPFGARSERYTWQNLDGGLIEKLSLCVHMEYCGAPLYQESQPFTEEESAVRETALQSYYGRQYNKDSSRSVALSLPYRLFNIRETRSSSADGNGCRLVRAAWNILDSDSYYSAGMLSKFAEQTAFLLPQEADFPDPAVRDTIEKLSAWEQLRWSRYMLSRGWMPADVSQVKEYTSGEYKKHQLYIARLHPAICDYHLLGDVQKELNTEFQSYNRRNLRNTSRILCREWLEKEKQMEMEDMELSLDS